MLIRPPSTAAVIFWRRTAGTANGNGLSSLMAGLMAGVARSDPGNGLASATKSCAKSKSLRYLRHPISAPVMNKTGSYVREFKTKAS